MQRRPRTTARMKAIDRRGPADAELGRHLQNVRKEQNGDSAVIDELDLANGDGMCLGYHGWREGDFGADPVGTPKTE